MELVYEKDSYGCYLKLLCYNGYALILDQSIAFKLDISWEKYIKILENNNAANDGIKFYNNFKTKQEAENAIKDLTPYLVMATLTE